MKKFRANFLDGVIIDSCSNKLSNFSILFFFIALMIDIAKFLFHLNSPTTTDVTDTCSPIDALLYFSGTDTTSPMETGQKLYNPMKNFLLIGLPLSIISANVVNFNNFYAEVLSQEARTADATQTTSRETFITIFFFALKRNAKKKMLVDLVLVKLMSAVIPSIQFVMLIPLFKKVEWQDLDALNFINRGMCIFFCAWLTVLIITTCLDTTFTINTVLRASPVVKMMEKMKPDDISEFNKCKQQFIRFLGTNGVIFISLVRNVNPCLAQLLVLEIFVVYGNKVDESLETGDAIDRDQLINDWSQEFISVLRPKENNQPTVETPEEKKKREKKEKKKANQAEKKQAKKLVEKKKEAAKLKRKVKKCSKR